jgi:Flp pilus assembly protein CpaB
MRLKVDSQPKGRSLGSRLSGGHWLVVLAGLVAVLLNFGALQDRDATTQVVVLAEDIPAGTTLTADDLRVIETRAGFESPQSVLSPDQVGEVVGQVATRNLRSGEFAYVEDFRNAAAPSALRAFAIPLDPSAAVGGVIAPTDRVDVIQALDGVAFFVALDLEVIAVPSTEDRGIGSSGFHVTVAVDAHTALLLARALEEGGVSLVRSTGAFPADETLTVGPREEPEDV